MPCSLPTLRLQGIPSLGPFFLVKFFSNGVTVGVTIDQKMEKVLFISLKTALPNAL